MSKFILKEDSVIKFGKHKGKEVSKILSSDPQYIAWVDSNIDWVAVDDILLKKALKLDGEKGMADAGSYAVNFSNFTGNDFMPPSDSFYN